MKACIDVIDDRSVEKDGFSGAICRRGESPFHVNYQSIMGDKFQFQRRVPAWLKPLDPVEDKWLGGVVRSMEEEEEEEGP